MLIQCIFVHALTMQNWFWQLKLMTLVHGRSRLYFMENNDKMYTVPYKKDSETGNRQGKEEHGNESKTTREGS